MNLVQIIVSRDFTDTPGSRYKADGPFSGEEFYERLLKSKFAEALVSGNKLFIDLDGCWGFASSFISESFGKLADDFGVSKVLVNLDLKSDEDPTLIERIHDEIHKSKNDD
jgi:hypothetical protein